MFVRELPTTCFGENLRVGVLRIAEYCMVESLCLVVFFALCFLSDIAENWNSLAIYDTIPVFLLLITIVKIMANTLLIQGTKNGNADYLKLWLYVYGVNTAVMMLFMVAAGIAMAVFFPPKINAYLSAAQCIVFVLYCALFKQFSQVVYAYKLQMERDRDPMTTSIVDESEII